jgi:hypothetical protein
MHDETAGLRQVVNDLKRVVLIEDMLGGAVVDREVVLAFPLGGHGLAIQVEDPTIVAFVNVDRLRVESGFLEDFADVSRLHSRTDDGFLSDPIAETYSSRSGSPPSCELNCVQKRRTDAGVGTENVRRSDVHHVCAGEQHAMRFGVPGQEI